MADAWSGLQIPQNELLLRYYPSILAQRRFRLAAGWLAWRFAAICHPGGDFRRGFHLVRVADATEYHISDSNFAGRNFYAL